MLIKKISKILFVAIFGLLTRGELAFSSENDFTYFSLNELDKNNSHIGLDGMSTLYDEIQNEFINQYEKIGKNEADKILNTNDLSIIAGLNSIGFSYAHPFVNFSLVLDRNMAPDLFDDKRWIVTDSMTIEVDASKLLGNLKDQGIIDITKENLGAFVGVVFKRKYTWVHFANSYREGISTDFEKLFMPFRSFTTHDLKKINDNEMIFKEDAISFKAGGLVSAPLYTGISGAMGVMANFQKLAKVEVIGLEDDKLQVNSEKTKIISAGANLHIQADFLSLLKLTILSYDFSYDLESSYKTYLNIPRREILDLADHDVLSIELKQILKNREADLDILAPYLISQEKKISQSYNHKYNFLLMGAHKSSKTQQIEIAKDNKVKNYFRHYYEKVKYTQSLMSKLIMSLVNVVTQVDLSTLKLASESKKITIEYDGNRNLMDEKSDLIINDSDDINQKLSLVFESNFKTQATKGMTNQKYKERALFILDRFSGVDPLAIDMFERDHLVAPVVVDGRYLINLNGLRFFNHLSANQAIDSLNGLCEEYPKNKFFNFRSLFNVCKNEIQKSYVDYMKDLSHEKVTLAKIESCQKKSLKYFLFPAKKRAYIKNCIGDLTYKNENAWNEIPLWSLKNLSQTIVNNTYSKVHFYNLFGVENVFFYGSFDAKTSDGRNFTTHFNEGAFNGLGAVDHYMRVENIRAPASVVTDD